MTLAVMLPVFLLSLVFSVQSRAQVADDWLIAEKGQLDYLRQIDWHVEGKSQVRPEDILRGTWPDARALTFTDYHTAMEQRDVSRPVWMRWTVRNDVSRPFEGVIFSSRAQIYKAVLYWQDNAGKLQQRRIDARAGLREVFWPEMVMNFPLNLAAGEERVYALYVPTQAMPGVFELRETKDFLYQMGILKTLYAIVAGVLAGMALYQIALSLFVYPGRSFAGAVFIGVVIWFILAKSGLLYPLHHGLGSLVGEYVVFSEMAMLVSAIHTARDVLDLRRQEPGLDRLAQVLQYLPLLSVILFFFNWTLATGLLQILAPACGLLILGSSALLAFRDHSSMARLMLVGWIPVVASGMVYLVFALGWIRFSFTTQAIIDTGFIFGVLVFSHGVSLRIAIDRKTRLERLQASEERYELAMEGSREGLFDWDFGDDRIVANKRAESILSIEHPKTGYSGFEWRNFLEATARDYFNRDLMEAIKNGDKVLAGEYAVAGSQDRRRQITVSASIRYDGAGNALRMVGSLSDVTDRHKMEEQLRHSALHDQLTNLPNRSLLVDRIEVSLLRHRRDENYHFGLLFIDLDRFKPINDTLGHNVGDAYLIGVARRLEHTVRAVDTLARWGGDEFVILVEALDKPDDAIILARRIEEALAPSIQIQSHELSISASIGVVTSANGISGADELIHEADVAMYAAKEAGRGRVVVFDETMREGATRRRNMEDRLRYALENQEFELHYQPVFLMEETPVIVGFEALLRWRREDTRELLPPHEFLSLAEENGLIREIGGWTIREAVQQMAHWKFALDRGDLFVNVNLSAAQMDDPELVSLVQYALEHAAMPAGTLRLEVLESAIMENPDVASDSLNRLSDMGVHIALDNFGTGYSSFNYLHNLPFDSLKVDRSLAVDIGVNSAARSKMAAILSMCRELKIEATAEGIETVDQYNILREIGCPRGQGYLVSPPVEAEQAARQIAESRRMSYDDQGVAI